MRTREWHEAWSHQDILSVRWHTSTGLCGAVAIPGQ